MVPMRDLELTDSMMDEIGRQIENADPDDPMRLLLIIERANYHELHRLKSNPAMRFGEMFRGMGRGFTLLLVVIAWFVLIMVPNTLYRLLTLLSGIDVSGLVVP